MAEKIMNRPKFRTSPEKSVDDFFQRSYRTRAPVYDDRVDEWEDGVLWQFRQGLGRVVRLKDQSSGDQRPKITSTE